MLHGGRWHDPPMGHAGQLERCHKTPASLQPLANLCPEGGAETEATRQVAEDEEAVLGSREGHANP